MGANRVMSMAMIASLCLGLFAAPATSSVEAASTVSTKKEAKEEHSHGQGPFDLAIANEERLIDMLKKRGDIPEDASAKEAEKAVDEFLDSKAEGLKEMEDNGELHKEELELESDVKEKLKKENEGKANDQAKKKGGKKNLDPVVEEEYNGEVRSDDVLVILMEFSDFPKNSIEPGETDMYYEDYVKEHYEDLIFGEDGYEGPNGENLVSMKQFYEQQTNGAYTVDGQVAGWYEASEPAAYYGGNNPQPDGNDKDPRSLVKEALAAAAKDPDVNLADYDKEDRYDLDGDGDYHEPDGLVDHLMVVHSAVGEEAGGGQLGGDAIWSHRWNLGSIFPIPGSPEPEVDYWGEGSMYAYDYTIEPADGAAGVFAHEYAHDLGLPDEYDTQYTGAGEAVGYWSLMSSGSWAGDIPGTEPTGFSAWSKEFLQAKHDGNWLKYDEVDIDEIDSKGMDVYLDQANTKGTNLDALRVNLPNKETRINTPYSGEYEYFSGSDDELDNSAVFDADLSNATAGELTFKAWYDIETDWDYGSVKVSEDGEKWTSIPGNITTDTNPNEQNPGHGITGKSDGWVDAVFDLSSYAGKDIQVKVNYWTDVAAIHPGLYVDEIRVTAQEGKETYEDGEFTAEQKGERVYVYKNGKQIYRTNGNGDNGKLKALADVDGEAVTVVEHYKKGNMILLDADPKKEISAKQAGSYFDKNQESIKEGNYEAKYDKGSNRVSVFYHGMQLFRTNGNGDNGTLHGLFIMNDEPYVLVKHHKKGMMILKDGDPKKPISADLAGTLQLEGSVTEGEEFELLFDDAEGEPKVTLDGFTKSDGVKISEHYYLLEWRNHQGVDEGLGNIRRGNSLMAYDPGLVIWYADNKYTDNWTGIHPGEGFLGVVDSDQQELFWSDDSVAQTRYQIHDAAFSLRKDEKLFVDYRDITGLTLKDKNRKPVKVFDDSLSYLNEAIPDAGRNVPEYGLKIKVTGEASDRSVGRVSLTKDE
ncbi:immune inhibitor A [Halobacillus sp. A1]|uniref:immune inhibitor A domain-containing protein n=1 Tax=Halobacillus sp. A1 TaxID=2880262 RepID=UPI0020A6ABE9|nr:immune inhibitor A domain-containing protein [Halobacillus sp. A1]MCP3032275.1 immune inhibitor A [Halobacillus sp. A1]